MVDRARLDLVDEAILGDGQDAFESGLPAVRDHGLVRVDPGVVGEHEVLDAGVSGDLAGLTRVQMAVGVGRLLVADLGRGLADQEIGLARERDQASARLLAAIEPEIARVHHGLAVRVQAEGQGVALVAVVRYGSAFDPTIVQALNRGHAHQRNVLEGRHVDALEHREGQALPALTFEVEGVEDRDVLNDVPGRVHAELRELVLLLPGEARTSHFVTQAGLQETLQAAVIRVGVADGQVADLVRILADPLQPLGDARGDVEQHVLITLAPANEEAGVGSLGLAVDGRETGTGTEDVDTH